LVIIVSTYFQQGMEALEILKYTIPAIIVFLTTVIVNRQFFARDLKQQRIQLAIESREITLPLKLQAFERLVLLLERISPEALVMRVSANEKTARQYQSELLLNIRNEFDHNVTQQIYVTPATWAKVLQARTQITQLINITTQKVGEMAPALKLRQKILEELMSKEVNPSNNAIDVLKKEARKII
jgi:hypothetical protein